jgi:hypothetical protein
MLNGADEYERLALAAQTPWLGTHWRRVLKLIDEYGETFRHRLRAIPVVVGFAAGF